MPRNYPDGARFRGTIEAYLFYIQPSITNEISDMIRPVRRALTACQRCGGQHRAGDRPLESAHLPGRGRPAIIRELLEPYKLPGTDIIECDLRQVHAEIIEAHRNFGKVFLFVCRSCHSEMGAEEKRMHARPLSPQRPYLSRQTNADNERQSHRRAARAANARPGTVGHYANQLLLEVVTTDTRGCPWGHSYTEVIQRTKKQFPDNNPTMNTMRWYESKLRTVYGPDAVPRRLFE
jgi:cytochrome c553